MSSHFLKEMRKHIELSFLVMIWCGKKGKMLQFLFFMGGNEVTSFQKDLFKSW